MTRSTGSTPQASSTAGTASSRSRKVPSDIFPLLLMRPDLDRLTAARGPIESYSDVIVRLARLRPARLVKGNLR
jgi:hypothetical protein